MSNSPSLEFSDEFKERKVANSVDIDLCSPRQDDPDPVEEVEPAAVARATLKEDDIDPTKFFVPLSKQGFGVLHRQANAASLRSVVMAPPPLTQSKGKWKKKATYKRGRAASAPKNPRPEKKQKDSVSKKKKATGKREEDDDEEEKQVEEVAVAAPLEQSKLFPRNVVVAASVPAIIAQVELPKTAREYFTTFKQREVDRAEPGASQQEKEEMIATFWESLTNLERCVYDKLAELDSRRYAAELKIAKQ